MENFLRKNNQNHQNNARGRKLIYNNSCENNFGYTSSIGVHIITAIVCANLWQNFFLKNQNQNDNDNTQMAACMSGTCNGTLHKF